jgi:hypothetical protein
MTGPSRRGPLGAGVAIAEDTPSPADRHAPIVQGDPMKPLAGSRRRRAENVDRRRYSTSIGMVVGSPLRLSTTEP